MVKTGGSLFIALSLVVMLMPLLPLCILLVRRIAPTAVLNVLGILCLFSFLQHLLTSFILPPNDVISAIFQLGQCLLILYLFKLLVTGKQAREIMKLFMVSLLSVVVTMFAIRGVTAFATAITVIQSLVLILLGMSVILQLIGKRDMYMLNEPAFWIAGGVVSYYGMIIFLELMTASITTIPQQVILEKQLVLLGTDMIRFTFFTLAVLVAPVNTGKHLH